MASWLEVTTIAFLTRGNRFDILFFHKVQAIHHDVKLVFGSRMISVGQHTSKGMFQMSYGRTFPTLTTYTLEDGIALRHRLHFPPSHPRFDSWRSRIYFNVGENYRQRHFLERVDSARSLRVAQTHLVLVCWKSRTSKKLFRPFDGIFFSPLLQIFYVFCLKFE